MRTWEDISNDILAAIGDEPRAKKVMLAFAAAVGIYAIAVENGPNLKTADDFITDVAEGALAMASDLRSQRKAPQ